MIEQNQKAMEDKEMDADEGLQIEEGRPDVEVVSDKQIDDQAASTMALDGSV